MSNKQQLLGVISFIETKGKAINFVPLLMTSCNMFWTQL